MQLTIAIPTYNRSEFLDKNLNKLYMQKSEKFKVIIQDNNSTDNTINIVKKYISLGLDIDYKKNNKNLGWEKTLNYALKGLKQNI